MGFKMSREIKFRAWDKHKKIMIYDQDQKVAENYGLLPGDWISCLILKIGILNGAYMQYTGFKDYKDREIYEGDIIKEGLDICEVIFEDGCFFLKSIGSIAYTHTPSFKRKEIYKKDGYRIIIGNIYENSELI